MAHRPRWIEFGEIISTPYCFYEVDRLRAKEQLKAIEIQIKQIRKRNSISEFKLIKPLCHTARWLNGLLTLMNHHIPPIRRNNYWGAVHGIGGYSGAWKARTEIANFLQGRNVPKGSKSMTLCIHQIMG